MDVPERANQLVACDAVRIIRRWRKGDREVAKCDIKQILGTCIGSAPPSIPKLLEGTHLHVLSDLKLDQDDTHNAEAEHEVPRVLLSLRKRTVARDELLPEALECWARARHEGVQESVDGKAGGLGEGGELDG